MEISVKFVGISLVENFTLAWQILRTLCMWTLVFLSGSIVNFSKVTAVFHLRKEIKQNNFCTFGGIFQGYSSVFA